MVDLLREDEETPATYPDLPPGITPLPASLDEVVIWERIEAYTRMRYTERAVVWVIETETNERWTPPLFPIVSFDAEIWQGGEWNPITIKNGPVGLSLPHDGIFKITAQVGAGDPPKAVHEAFKRLYEYMNESSDMVGVSSYSVNMGGAIQESYQRSAAHAARSIQLSGAADLLRPYKRCK
ncbi:hypothetical protein [Kiloniella sp.]|uniref:hypothetical protein n=1 Tax=Kiloniella sp. TaxID=1938587 RepID=UPI003A92C1F3